MPPAASSEEYQRGMGGGSGVPRHGTATTVAGSHAALVAQVKARQRESEVFKQAWA
eukprot:gene6642-6488_t